MPGFNRWDLGRCNCPEEAPSYPCGPCPIPLMDLTLTISPPFDCGDDVTFLETIPMAWNGSTTAPAWRGCDDTAYPGASGPCSALTFTLSCTNPPAGPPGLLWSTNFEGGPCPGTDPGPLVVFTSCSTSPFQLAFAGGGYGFTFTP